MSSYTLLLTGAGAPGIKGTLFCLRELPYTLQIVGTDIKKDPVGAHFVDQFHQVPPPESPDYVEVMFSLTQKYGVNLIIPQTTREIEALSLHRGKFKSAGVELLASPHSAVARANHKGKLLEAFRDLSLPHPRFELVRSKEQLLLAVKKLGYPHLPVVVKPPKSSGMRGFRVLTESVWSVDRFFSEKPSGYEMPLDALLGILAGRDDFPELLVTEYLPGPEFSIDAFRGKEVRIALARRRDAIRSGISFETTLEPQPEMERMTMAVADYLDIRYVFGMQFKLDSEGAPKILECNPRIQGTMVASISSGLNLIGLAVQEALGETIRELPTPLFGERFSRYWGGVVKKEGALHLI